VAREQGCVITESSMLLSEELYYWGGTWKWVLLWVIFWIPTSMGAILGHKKGWGNWTESGVVPIVAGFSGLVALIPTLAIGLSKSPLLPVVYLRTFLGFGTNSDGTCGDCATGAMMKVPGVDPPRSSSTARHNDQTIEWGADFGRIPETQMDEDNKCLLRRDLSVLDPDGAGVFSSTQQTDESTNTLSSENSWMCILFWVIVMFVWSGASSWCIDKGGLKLFNFASSKKKSVKDIKMEPSLWVPVGFVASWVLIGFDKYDGDNWVGQPGTTLGPDTYEDGDDTQNALNKIRRTLGLTGNTLACFVIFVVAIVMAYTSRSNPQGGAGAGDGA